MTKKSESLVWKQLIMVLKSKSFYLESVNYGQKVGKSEFEYINYDKGSKSLIQNLFIMTAKLTKIISKLQIMIKKFKSWDQKVLPPKNINQDQEDEKACIKRELCYSQKASHKIHSMNKLESMTRKLSAFTEELESQW